MHQVEAVGQEYGAALRAGLQLPLLRVGPEHREERAELPDEPVEVACGLHPALLYACDYLLHEAADAAHELVHRGRDAHLGEPQEPCVVPQRVPQLLADEGAGGLLLQRRLGGRGAGALRLLLHALQDLRHGARLLRVAHGHQRWVALQQPGPGLRERGGPALLAQGVAVLVHVPRERLLLAPDEALRVHGDLEALQRLPAVRPAGVEVLHEARGHWRPEPLPQECVDLTRAAREVLVEEEEERLQHGQNNLRRGPRARNAGLATGGRPHVARRRRAVLNAPAVILRRDPSPGQRILCAVGARPRPEALALRQPPGRLQQRPEHRAVQLLRELLHAPVAEVQDLQRLPDLLQGRRRQGLGCVRLLRRGAQRAPAHRGTAVAKSHQLAQGILQTRGQDGTPLVVLRLRSPHHAGFRGGVGGGDALQGPGDLQSEVGSLAVAGRTRQLVELPELPLGLEHGSEHHGRGVQGVQLRLHRRMLGNG
mmetsp:Transcript_110790/g.357593  ORF Transcript_110790/g.357593 Transcript_110790/m.357593 type:complete len:482 (-) Transcript_110790:370-1815(-)